MTCLPEASTHVAHQISRIETRESRRPTWLPRPRPTAKIYIKIPCTTLLRVLEYYSVRPSAHQHNSSNMSQAALTSPSPAPGSVSKPHPRRPASAAASSDTPIHILVLDANALIRNDPPAASLRARCTVLATVPEVLAELRDATVRARVEALLRPFLTVRTPRPASVAAVRAVARRSGDDEVLSRADVAVVALGWEMQGEREKEMDGCGEAEKMGGQMGDVEGQMHELGLGKDAADGQEGSVEPDWSREAVTEPEDADSDSDSDGWITPRNLKKKQERDAGTTMDKKADAPTMHVAIVTTDYAMQNVILQMRLALLSPTLTRIRQIRTSVLRCHACFQVVKDTSRQFCPRCGQPTLTHVSCSTNASGVFRLHLRAKPEWNRRGDRYSIPKPTHGSANGKKRAGGGRNGWGHDLILTEDQKEYQRAADERKRTVERSLMDEDRLPGIVTGERGQTRGRVRVGAGRDVNSRKR